MEVKTVGIVCFHLVQNRDTDRVRKLYFPKFYENLSAARGGGVMM